MRPVQAPPIVEANPPIPDDVKAGGTPSPLLGEGGGAAITKEFISTDKAGIPLELMDRQLAKVVLPAGADGVHHSAPLDDEGKPYMPPIPDEGPSPDSIQAQHLGGYDFLEDRDPRRGMPKWLNGEELLQYISLAIPDMIEEWRPVKANPHVMEVIMLLMKDLRMKWKPQPHFHPMRSQPIAMLEVTYAVSEHGDRVIVSLLIAVTTPEQKDLKSLAIALDATWESDVWKSGDESMQEKIAGEAHPWSKNLSLDISKPNVARKRLLQHEGQSTQGMTIDAALDKLRQMKVKGTSDWIMVQPIDGEPYIFSDRGSYTIDEAKLVAASGM